MGNTTKEYPLVAKEDKVKESRPLFAIYVRTSVEDPNPEGSLRSQEVRIIDYLNSMYGKGNIETNLYKDSGFTGLNNRRPSYQQMILDVKNNILQGIISTELSRFGRNVVELNQLLNLCQEKKAAFITLAERIDTSSPYGLIVFNVFAALAEIESKRISERVHLNAERRAKDGLFTGRKILGYSLGKEIRGRLEINEEEAKIVRLIFEKYLEYGSYYRVCDWLNRSCVWHDGNWHNSTVERTLKNIAYIGKRLYRGNMIDAVWSPIIELDMFNRVQNMLRENHRYRHSILGERNHKYLLHGKIFCVECQQFLLTSAGTAENGNQYYYYKHTSQRPNCPFSKYIPAGRIEKMIFERINTMAAISSNEGIHSLILDYVLEQYQRQEAEYLQTINRIQKALYGLETSASQLIASIPFLSDLQRESLVKPQLDEIIAKKEAFLSEKEKNQVLLEKIKKAFPTPEMIQSKMKRLDHYLLCSSPKIQKKVIDLLVKKIDLTVNGIIIHTVHTPNQQEAFPANQELQF